MCNEVKRFNNGEAILVNGKCILNFVKLNGKTNRMDVAKAMKKAYPNSFSTLGEVIETIRAYEKNNNFVWTDKVAYFLHEA